MKASPQPSSAGLSLVELMIGLTIFVVVVLSIGGAHQLITKSMVSSQLTQKSLEYVSGEIDRLNRMSRIPERDENDELVYRDSNNQIVANGGELVPYGYTNFLTQDSLGGMNGEVVTYPDALSEQALAQTDVDRVQLRRKFTVKTLNANQEDEVKEITVELSDTQTKKRFDPVVQTVSIKKPNPQALDTRLARGNADLTGRVLDKNTSAPITGGNVTLTPNDGTTPRYSALDGSGRFYFSPPLNTKTDYILKVDGLTNYWSSTVPVHLTPGKNSYNGQSGDALLLDPVYYAVANITVLDYETGNPVPEILALVVHSNNPPNGAPALYNQVYTDASGKAVQTIKIPIPGLKTYNQYYYQGYKYGYMPYFPNGQSSQLNLNADNPTNYTFYAVRFRSGAMKVLVRDSDGVPSPKATVSLCDTSDCSSVIEQRNTDSTGVASFNEIFVNSNHSGEELRTTRDVYISAKVANHQITTKSSQLKADELINESINMQPHKLVFQYGDLSRQYQIGTVNYADAVAYYVGHDGARGNAPGLYIADKYNGIELSDFMGERVTETGFPGQYTFDGYDTSIIDVTRNTSWTDTYYITGKKIGSTDINVTATFSYKWNGKPYSLSLSKVHHVQITDDGSNIGVDILPHMNVYSPNSEGVWRVSTDRDASDMTYTWSVSGEGAASFQPVYSSGDPAPNGSHVDVQCKVRTSNKLGSTFTINLIASSASMNKSGSASQTVEVNYQPLSVVVNPPGPFQLTPGNSAALTATATGGSGTYSYLWSLVDANTGQPVGSTYGSLSNLTQPSTTFTASGITQVNAKVVVTDTDSSLTTQAISSFVVVPPGGVTQ